MGANHRQSSGTVAASSQRTSAQVSSENDLRPHLNVTYSGWFAGDDFAYEPRVAAAARGQLADERLGIVAAGHDDQTDPHVEGPHHVVAGDVAALLQPLEDRRHF